MLTLLFRRLATAIRQAVSSADRARSQRALCAILPFDDHLLRDIGLTRADFIDCVSNPLDGDPADFLEARRRRNVLATDRAASSGPRLAA